MPKFASKKACVLVDHLRGFPSAGRPETWSTCSFYSSTSCPARRCSGIRAPLHFVASFLCSAHALPLSLCCGPLSFLASRSIAQPTENPIEKICSPLNFCWLEKKKAVFEWLGINAQLLLISSSPEGSLLFLRSISFSLPCGDVLLLRAVCDTQSFNPRRWLAASLCWWSSVQTLFIVTLSRNPVNDRDCEHGKNQGFFSSLSELPASKDIFVVLTAYAGSLTNDLQSHCTLSSLHHRINLARNVMGVRNGTLTEGDGKEHLSSSPSSVCRSSWP